MEPENRALKESQSLQMRRRIFMILCVTGLFCIFSSVMSKNPVLNPFAKYLGTPAVWLGVIASASSIPGIIASLPAASLSDIFGRRKFLVGSAVVFASAPFCYLLIAPGAWWELTIVRFYQGFATAIFVPTAEAYVAELFPDKKGVRISLFSSSTAIGRGLAPVVGGAILQFTFSNYYIYYIAVGIAGITGLTLVLIFLFERRNKTITRQNVANSQDIDAPFEQRNSPTSLQDTTSRMLGGWKVVIKNRGAILISIVQAGQYYVYGSAEFFLTGYMADVAHLDPLLYGTINTCEIIALILVRPIMGRMGDKWGRRLPIYIGCGMGALPLILIPFVQSFPLILFFAVIYGCGFAAVISQTNPLVSEYVPKALVGTSMGFIDMMMDVGATIGPIISGLLLASMWGYYGAFFGLALVLLITGLIFGVVKTTPTLEVPLEIN